MAPPALTLAIVESTQDDVQQEVYAIRAADSYYLRAIDRKPLIKMVFSFQPVNSFSKLRRLSNDSRDCRFLESYRSSELRTRSTATGGRASIYSSS